MTRWRHFYRTFIVPQDDVGICSVYFSNQDGGKWEKRNSKDGKILATRKNNMQTGGIHDTRCRRCSFFRDKCQARVGELVKGGATVRSG